MAFDSKTKIIFPIILVALSTIIALSIAELCLRLSKIGYGNAPQESHSIFHHVHPAEYRFVSYTPAGEYGGHEVYYDKDRLVSNPNRNDLSGDFIWSRTRIRAPSIPKTRNCYLSDMAH
jgi:hypothetical protein